MKSYQDKWGRWHNKPCIDGEPSSNNGWIYTAYANYLTDIPRERFNNLECYDLCNRRYVPLKVDRNPGDKTPPLSKDEVIGLVSLGLVTRFELEISHWNFCNLDYRPEPLTLESAFKAAKLLWSIRKEHRNYVWENDLKEAYPLAFWLAPHDQYYVVKYYGEKPSILQTILFYINIITVLTSNNLSVKMILWLQLSDMDHWLASRLPHKKWAKQYFGEEHPFVQGD